MNTEKGNGVQNGMDHISACAWRQSCDSFLVAGVAALSEQKGKDGAKIGEHVKNRFCPFRQSGVHVQERSFI